MQYTDHRGDTYEIEFRRFYDGPLGSRNFGIEAISVGGYCNETYDDLAVWEPDCFVKGRHEYPNPYCLWTRNIRLAQAVIDSDHMKWTGRTTEFYGTKYYEVMPNEEWWASLPKKFY